MILEGLSDSRRGKVEEIELDQARRVLRKAAQKMEIRHWDEVLRVLTELERLERIRDERFAADGDVLQIVQPDGRNPTAEHVRSPRSSASTPLSLCGYRVDDWKVVDEVDWEDGATLLERAGLCDRCRRSLGARLGFGP